MFKLCLILSLSLCAFAIKQGATRMENLESYTFEQYLNEYEKSYSSAEYATREATFNSNLAMIIAHNADETQTFKLGVSQFTDLTQEDMNTFKGYKRSRSENKFTTESFLELPKSLDSYPDSVDWRNTQGVLTATKNQGGCGSCWAFSATESIESAVAISKSETAPVLAPQELVDCTPNPNQCGGTGGCEGATQQLGFEYAIGAGMTSENSYPYQGVDGSCQMGSKPINARISSYVNCTENDQNSLLDAIQKQPVSISVDAGGLMMHYAEGVYGACSKNAVIDHAIQLVGYDKSDSSNMYWIIRNSWGASWGNNGYANVQMFASSSDYCGTDSSPLSGSGCKGGPSSVKVCGMCGILYDNSYPVV